MKSGYIAIEIAIECLAQRRDTGTGRPTIQMDSGTPLLIEGSVIPGGRWQEDREERISSSTYSCRVLIMQR
jgi:hypothetical protein